MASPDFYFAIAATFRYFHERHGHPSLINYWRQLGEDYYQQRWQRWRSGGAMAIAEDWTKYFSQEPAAQVTVSMNESEVILNIGVCPAIHHLRLHNREVPDYFCEHCDHIHGRMAELAGWSFHREGGMGSCRQRFIPLTQGNT